jgi:hypothetical protein
MLSAPYHGKINNNKKTSVGTQESGFAVGKA